MDFNELVKSLQEFVGVSRKNSIEKVTKTLAEVYNVSGEVLLDFGDDASAIDIGNNQVILLAADGIWGQLMNVNPYWAGYCSVLVNVNDIAAMGGKPIAMVNTMSIFDDEIYDGLLQGIVDGCKKFNVPMVGGHLHPDSEFNSLDVAIAGIAKKDSLITSSGADVGDKVLRGIADVLKITFRDEDIIFRLGGDEYAAYVMNLNDEEAGKVVLERLFSEIAKMDFPELEERKVCVSAGAAFYKGGGKQSFEELYKLADSGVYESKKISGSALIFR